MQNNLLPGYSCLILLLKLPCLIHGANLEYAQVMASCLKTLTPLPAGAAHLLCPLLQSLRTEFPPKLHLLLSSIEKI